MAELNKELIKKIISRSSIINEKSKNGKCIFKIDPLISKSIKLSSIKIDYKWENNNLVIKINGAKKLLSL
ncbi:hypothetical protein EBU94_05025 [bacterium]|nr:hypothetical protein [bacterium]